MRVCSFPWGMGEASTLFSPLPPPPPPVLLSPPQLKLHDPHRSLQLLKAKAEAGGRQQRRRSARADGGLRSASHASLRRLVESEPTEEAGAGGIEGGWGAEEEEESEEESEDGSDYMSVMTADEVGVMGRRGGSEV